MMAPRPVLESVLAMHIRYRAGLIALSSVPAAINCTAFATAP